MQEHDKLFDVTEALLHYLANNPGSADTAEGIRDWWLHHNSELISVKEINIVIDKLVMMGKLSKQTLAQKYEPSLTLISMNYFTQ